MWLFAHAPLLVTLMTLGCQPTASIAQPGATRFEIPVAQELGPHTTAPNSTGPSTHDPGAKGPSTNTATPAPALPRELPRAFARKQTCAQGSCSLLRWLPEPSYALSPLEEVSAQAAIWVHDIQSGAKLTVPANDALEFVVVGLRGELLVHDTRSGANAQSEFRVDPWTALRASGAGVELDCRASDCQAMFALIAPKSTLDAEVGAAYSSTPRRIPLEVRSFEDAPLSTWEHGKNHARILFGGSDAGGPLPFSLTLLQNFAPALIPPHTHESSWENLLVLEGRGNLELRGRSYPIEGGESLHIGPRVRHGYVASGRAPFVALQLYTPAGPEQRFLAASPRATGIPSATVPR